MALVGAAALLVGLLWFDQRKETALLPPTGRFPVGRVTLPLSNAEVDLMAPKLGVLRGS